MKPKILEDAGRKTAADQYVRRDRIQHSHDWRHWATSLTPDLDHPGNLLQEGKNWKNFDLPPSFQISSHPELEDEALIAWGLAQSSGTENCGIVGLL